MPETPAQIQTISGQNKKEQILLGGAWPIWQMRLIMDHRELALTV